MTHLQMTYYGLTPYYIAIAASFFGISIKESIQSLLFLHSINLLNWICVYHWTLSMQSIQSQTKIACALVSLVSLWIVYTYMEGFKEMALYLISVLYLFQLYGDFRSDITYAIPPQMKLARVTSTVLVIYTLLRVL